MSGLLDEQLTNRQWTVAEHPSEGLSLRHFGYQEVPVESPRQGQILLETQYLNLAPVMRTYMLKDGGKNSPEASLKLGDVIHGRGVAKVIQSAHPNFSVGDFVHGQIGWQTYKVSSVSDAERIIKMTPRGLPSYYGLSALGMTGYSAYCGFMLRGEPKPSDTVLVSGAAGGVGSLVVQMAKAIGCKRVIGIAGGGEKCELVRSLGADCAIDYKNADLKQQLTEVAPTGIDLYFDNVGGEILQTVLENLRLYARVVLCGSISEYTRKAPFSLSNYTKLRATNSDFRGFFVYNHKADFPAAEQQIADWIKQGKLTPTVDILDGFEQMPTGLIGLYKGANKGKYIVRIKQGADLDC